MAVSPATVRNDMAALEQEGYLHQPHTSAGRVPTDKGYRFFVDRLDAGASLAAADSQQVRSFFAEAHGELEQMLADTSRLLSDLTHYAAVVVGPPAEAATVRSVQLVGLAPRVALVVRRAVQRRGRQAHPRVRPSTSTTPPWPLASARLAAAPHRASRCASADRGRRAGRHGPPSREPSRWRRAPRLGVLAADHSSAEHVYIGGTVAHGLRLRRGGTVSEVLHILEQQYVVVTLLQDVLDRGLHVAIGTETGMAPLADCSVVVAPYAVDGEPAGTIGVLGPTRMNYPQALAAVAVVGQRLGRHLSEG